MIKRTIKGYHGINNPITDILVYGSWYVVKGSLIINKAASETEFYDGMSVETISDIDIVTSNEPVYSVDELARNVDEYEVPCDD